MPSIKATSIRDIKERVNIVDVISRVVTLKKAGARYKGLCPFHNEKTPSFHVDAHKGFYKCFGCGKAGDAITFVRETEQLTFTEAIETLGKRFNIPVEYEAGSGPTREERSLREELLAMHDLAAEHFHQNFRSKAPIGDWMRKYWTEERHFSMEIGDDFKIGAATPEDNDLAALVLREKFSENAIRQSGLFFIRDNALITLGNLRSRFRGRLMIPIRDHQGRVVAFTARQTQLTPKQDPAYEAKYTNSPETPIFTKSNLLFNLDRARTHLSDEQVAFVLVEGQLDAIRCWSVGLKTAIAPQGTSITENQLTLLHRYASKIECLFDSDSAGQKAAMRLLPMALKANFEIRFLSLSDNHKIDPDILFLERGIDAYRELKQHSKSAMTFACQTLLPQPTKANPEEKARVAQEIYAITQNTESIIARNSFREEAAKLLKIDMATMDKDFQRQDQVQRVRNARSGGKVNTTTASDNTPHAIVKTQNPEYHLLFICLNFEEVGEPLAHIIDPEWVDNEQVYGRLLNRFLAEFEHHTWPGRDHLDALLEDDEERSAMAALLFEKPDKDINILNTTNQALRELHKRALEYKKKEIELALAGTPADSDVDLSSLFQEHSHIISQLKVPPQLH